MILLFSLIIELMAKKEEQRNTPYLNSDPPYLPPSVLQKSVPLSFVTQHGVKLFVFPQSNNEKIVRSTRFLFLVIKYCEAI